MYVQYDSLIDCQAYINRIEAVTIEFCKQYFPERVGLIDNEEVLMSISTQSWEVNPNATPTTKWDNPRPTIDGKFCALKPTQEQVGQVPIKLYDAVIEEGVEIESYTPLP